MAVRLIFAAWSLEGTRSRWNIYRMNADGSDSCALTASGAWQNEDPTWSPDGRLVAYISNRLSVDPNNYGIFIIPATCNTAATPIAFMVAPDIDYQAPAWSPDGRKLAFRAMYTSGYTDIYMADVDLQGNRDRCVEATDQRANFRIGAGVGVLMGTRPPKSDPLRAGATMNTNDLLTQWSTLSLDEIAARLASGQDTAAAEQLFGAEDGRRADCGRAKYRPRAASACASAVVLLPGIMGSLLAAIRGVTSLLWINPAIFLEGNASYLELDDDGTADATPPSRRSPVGIEKLVYLKIELALRRRPSCSSSRTTGAGPSNTTPTCWPAAWQNGPPEADKQFTLVGHSMGGHRGPRLRGAPPGTRPEAR